MNRRKKHKRGFTLIEVLIVIVIIGIMASLAIPRLFPQTENARAAEAINLIGVMRHGQEAYLLEHGVYLPLPDNGKDGNGWPLIGIEDPHTATRRFFNYEIKADGNDEFEITATRRNVDPGGAAYKDLVIEMDYDAQSQESNWEGDHPFVPGN